MEHQEYAKIMRGKLYLHDYSTSDGSGWSIENDRYYLVFDAKTKEELWQVFPIGLYFYNIQKTIDKFTLTC